MTFIRIILLILVIQQSLFAQVSTSYYVSVDETTRLALDVHLPEDYKSESLPTLVVFTRYWRASVSKKTKEPNSPFGDLDTYFSENGYAIVKVDTRGSGASFGTRLGEYTPVEVMDAKAIIDWVTSQPWCDGNIGSYGTSYEGTTAELLCATNHPAVKAVIPGWSDFDIYRSPVRPYGMLASGFIKKWSRYVWLLDHNNGLILRETVLPVNDSLKYALKEHKQNPNIYKLTKNAPHRNSSTGLYDYIKCSPVAWKKQIEKSNVPMLVLTSWMDAGTAEGTLQRLSNFSNPQNVIMMATSHGGWSNASPFVVEDTLFFPDPKYDEQHKLQLDFLDHYLKGVVNDVEDWPLIRYMNMGEEKFKESDQWPVKGVSESNFYFQEENGLSENRPTDTIGFDDYKIDFSVTTGTENRWTTQMGGPVRHLNKRNEQDDKMLTYTTSPMKEDLQITGTPTITLNLSSTHKDGAIFVYLEDVDENGVSCYITEGGIRLIHREKQENTDAYNLHSFNKEDAEFMQPGVIDEVIFKFWPTSVLIQKGHSLRVAISGADKATFDRIPKHGKPIITIHRSNEGISFLTLPVVR